MLCVCLFVFPFSEGVFYGWHFVVINPHHHPPPFLPSSLPSHPPHFTEMAPQQTSQPSAINLLLGASLNIFECATLGQPFEVLKTHMAANRQDTLAIAAQKAYTRGGMRGFYQGLWPWAIIEVKTCLL